VFWHDRLTGETRLVSNAGAGTEGNGDSWAPSISADGLNVAFESDATNLVNADTNGVRDVFVWNATNGVTRVVGSAGEGNAASSEPSISGDGKVVAFTSYASNLDGTVAGTTNANVYRSVIANGTCTLVSHANASASEGNFGSSKPSISEDGTRIAFWSYASDLTASDTNGLWDIFVYDSTAGTNTRVSLANGGTERNQGGDSISGIVPPTISGNGRYVAYSTLSTNVVASDTNGVRDVFVVDTQTSGASLSVVRASVSSTGTQGDGASPIAQSDRIALSYDGNLVAFNTAATNLGTNSSYNVVIRNASVASTSVMTATGGSTPSYVSLSRGGSYVNFLSGAVGLDARFNSSGVYTRFTGMGRAWAWLD
jgi:Tol biopolymer transport system component